MNTTTMTRSEVTQLMAANGISGLVSGVGEDWSVELDTPDNDGGISAPAALVLFCTLVDNVGASLSPEGVWTVRPVAPPSDVRRSREDLRALQLGNHAANRGSYQGWTTDEIADNSRRTMFGENDEAFPSAEEWSRIVD